MLFAQRRAGGATHGQAGKPLIVRHLTEKLPNKAGFSNAGFADEPNNMRLAFERSLQTIEHAAQFGIAPDERRAQPQCFEPTRLARRIERADQAMDRGLPALAFERDLANWLEREDMTGEPIGCRPNQNFATAGERLKPLRRIHRVARDRIGLRPAGAKAARDHGTGVDAKVKGERLAGTLAPTGIKT